MGQCRRHSSPLGTFAPSDAWERAPVQRAALDSYSVARGCRSGCTARHSSQCRRKALQQRQQQQHTEKRVQTAPRYLRIRRTHRWAGATCWNQNSVPQKHRTGTGYNHRNMNRKWPSMSRCWQELCPGLGAADQCEMPQWKLGMQGPQEHKSVWNATIAQHNRRQGGHRKKHMPKHFIRGGRFEAVMVQAGPALAYSRPSNQGGP